MRLRKGRRTGGVAVRAAMFDSLSRSMERAWKMVSKDGKLSKENIAAPLKEIRRALLEADVSLPVVRRFIKKVEEKALGQQVIVGVTPETAFVKVVNDELIALMGASGAKELEPGFPQVILLAGLQGVGKTTAAAKLALYLTKQKKSVLLVAVDVYRPAAIEQLVKLGASIDVPVFELGTELSPVVIAQRGVEEAKRTSVDVVIVDTAGRLQVDGDMMAELKAIKAAVRPSDTLLVVDAMTGQEAASLVKTFNDEVDITGAILTKMDGDSRGGAALSVREVSGKPVKFVGLGEKMESLEPFYPERMAGRILGKGDVLTLYEKAQSAINDDEAAAQLTRMMDAKFDFNDFLNQWKAMNNMGGMQMMKMLPGFNKVTEKQLYETEKKFNTYETMIGAMTAEEREDPEMLARSPALRRRIAQAAKHTEVEVATMMAEFNVLRSQARNLGRMMRLGQGGPNTEETIRELVASSARQVSEGKVRRRKVPAPQAGLDKGKGVGAAAATPPAMAGRT